MVPLTNGTAKRARASECLPSALRAIEGSLAPSCILAKAMAAPLISRDWPRPTLRRGDNKNERTPMPVTYYSQHADRAKSLGLQGRIIIATRTV